MSRDLINTVNWQNKSSRDHDLAFVKKPKKAVDAITALEEETAGGALEVRVKPGESAKQTKARQKTQQFIELVKNGLSPEDAAARIGLDLGEVQKLGSKSDMARIVAETLEVGHIRSDIRKEYLRAGLNKMLTEAMLDGDRKEFGSLYKLAASDPDVGLTGPSTVNAIQVNFTDLKSVIGEFLENSEEDDKKSVDSLTPPDVLSVCEPETDGPPLETESN